jgi:hypothetical protein
MRDQDRSEQLPHRVVGAGEGRPAPPAPSALSQQLRQRLQAAVDAERAQASGPDLRDQERLEPPREALPSAPADHGAAAPPAGQAAVGRPVTPGSAADEGSRSGTPAMRNPAAVRAGPPGPGAHQAKARRHLFATGLIATVLILIAAGSLGVAVGKYVTTPRVQLPKISPALERAETLAASWVFQQVSRADHVVSCDPQMCTALTAAGFPARDVQALEPTTPYLVPLGSKVIVVTQTVRDLYGSWFTSEYAPAVLATFGSGDDSITVRVIAAGGAAMYSAQQRADVSQRKEIWTTLASDRRISTSAEAKQQLLAGLVDGRLLFAILSLIEPEPINIVDFGNIGPGVGPGIALRYMDLAVTDRAAHLASAAYVQALQANLRTITYRPVRTVIKRLPSGQAVLRIEFAAPTPFGLLVSQ